VFLVVFTEFKKSFDLARIKASQKGRASRKLKKMPEKSGDFDTIGQRQA